MSLSPTRLPTRFGAFIGTLEVLAVFAAGSLLGFLAAGWFGVALRNPLMALVEQPDAALAPLALELAKLLFWQYLGWGLCGGLMWLARPRPAEPAVASPARVDRRALLKLTLWTCALCALPSIALTQAQHIWQFGQRAPWYDALQQRPWDWQFWLFTAVGSFVLIPLVEECFYRGYVFRRLAVAWAPAPAVALSATLFAFAHAQYLQLDAFNLVMLVNVCYLGCVLALATWQSGSLIPAIVAHALINLPMSGAVAIAVLAASVAALVMTRGQWPSMLRSASDRQARAISPGTIAAALLGAAFAAAFARWNYLMALCALPVLGCLLLVYLGMRVQRQ